MVKRADKYCNRQAGRQAGRQRNYMTPYTGVCGFFLSLKFATSLPNLLAGGLTR